MPLKPGKANVGANISELTHNGSRPRSHDQIVAIALDNARRRPRANGGSVIDNAVSLAHDAARKKLAGGGGTKTADSGQTHPGGLIASAGPGRTDTHNVSVAPGSFVLPADVVSGLGEGNTLAGSRVIEAMLSGGPYGTKLDAGPFGIKLDKPRRPAAPKYPAAFQESAPATDGLDKLFSAVGDTGKRAAGGPTPPIPIVIAGGEFLVNPEYVAKLGGGDAERGMAILDSFVKHIRKKTIKTLRHLPGPVK